MWYYGFLSSILSKIWRQWHGPASGAVFQNFTQPQAWRSNTTCLGGVDPAGSLWNHLQLNTLLRVIPSLTNLLDILSHILSGIYSDILSHVEKRVKISASLATTSTAISDLQKRRWPLYVPVCESIRMVQWLSQEYLTFFLAFYLASFLPFFLTFFLALCLTYVLTSYLEAWRSIWHVFGMAFGSRQWGAAPLSKSTLGRSGNKTKHEATRPQAPKKESTSTTRSVDLKDDVQPVVDIKGHKQQICKSSAMHQASRLG